MDDCARAGKTLVAGGGKCLGSNLHSKWCPPCPPCSLRPLTPVLLLIGSNVFMTLAWYGHLRFKHVDLWKVILISWLIALIVRPSSKD